MTTSVTATLRGDLRTAAGANPAGIVLVVVALVVVAGLLQHRSLTLPRWSTYGVLAFLWAFELTRYRII